VKEAAPIITLTTDFGQSDGYVGTMVGVILSICPTVTISHLSHQIPPQNIQAAAFVLYQSFSYYPAHTIHCVVVDPGVGSQRRAIALKTDLGTFVGPDNGVFSLALSATNVVEAVSLSNPDYQLSKVSTTFHGRDIFAPAAAHLAAGLPLSHLGSTVTDLVQLSHFSSPASSECRVIHIDHFGNIVLSLTIDEIKDPAHLQLKCGQITITSLSQTFADVEAGNFLAYVGSSRNHIEIAIRNGNAAQALDLQLGDVVQVIV
jgi:S-adenosylmethionine hydrolase